ncbi:MAG: hypothetical protein KDA24_03990 [Deltaproteobacteria bacterium]|nr:hypothetical protein [Deltaproteobacteria bacterium]
MNLSYHGLMERLNGYEETDTMNDLIDSKHFRFKSQDSDYRLYDPVLKTYKETDGTTLCTVDLDHVRGGSGSGLDMLSEDDRATLKLTFLPDCTLTKAEVHYSEHGQSPVMEILDVAVGAVGELTPGPVAAAISVGGAVFNWMAGKLVEASDDGGRTTFVAVVANVVNAVVAEIRQ